MFLQTINFVEKNTHTFKTIDEGSQWEHVKKKTIQANLGLFVHIQAYSEITQAY